MPIVENITKAKLKAGEIAIGVGLRQARTVDTAKILKVCGFDWLFIDMEHNSMSMETAAQLCVAGLDAGVTPIVRAPSHEIGRAQVRTPVTNAQLVCPLLLEKTK